MSYGGGRHHNTELKTWRYIVGKMTTTWRGRELVLQKSKQFLFHFLLIENPPTKVWTWKCQREHIGGYLRHMFNRLTNSWWQPLNFVTDFNLNTRFSSFLVNRNSPSRKLLALEYRIRWEIYIPYAGTAGMLLPLK